MIAFRIWSLVALLFFTAFFSQAQETLRPPTANDLIAPHVTVANVPDQHKPHIDRWWIGSMFAVGGATAADAVTSWGKLESNSILASKNGTFGAKGVEIKGALAAGILVPQILLRKRAELRKTFLIGNTGATGLFTAAAVHNTDVPKK